MSISSFFNSLDLPNIMTFFWLDCKGGIKLFFFWRETHFEDINLSTYNSDVAAINLLARKLLLLSNFATNFVDIVCSRPYNIKRRKHQNCNIASLFVHTWTSTYKEEEKIKCCLANFAIQNFQLAFRVEVFYWHLTFRSLELAGW